jgi:hypothetical protein
LLLVTSQLAARLIAYLVSAGRLQDSQKKISPKSEWTTLKPVGIASTLKSKVRFSGCERRADPDIPQSGHVSNSIHLSTAVMHADSQDGAKQTYDAAIGCSELLTFEINADQKDQFPRPEPCSRPENRRCSDLRIIELGHHIGAANAGRPNERGRQRGGLSSVAFFLGQRR